MQGACTERLDQYLAANNITEFDKRGILLSSVGAATYKLMRNLKQSSFLYIYKDIIRFKFNSSNRESGESVAFYRQLNELCNFRDSLQPMLSNWLVCGINDTQIQRHQLSEPARKNCNLYKFWIW